MNDLTNIGDSFSGFVNGLELMAASPYTGVGANSTECDAAYISSTWYGKILTIPVDDAVKEWRAWQAKSAQIELLEAEENRLNYREVVRQGQLIARHTGGGVILPIGLPGHPSTPLSLDRIGRGTLKRLVNLDRSVITPGPVDRNPLSEYFGQPSHWQIQDMRIHPSRVCLVNGRRPPGSTIFMADIWGSPIWTYLRKPIVASDDAATIIMALLEEAKIDVVSIPELAAMMMTSAGVASLQKRWNAAAQLKAISNITLIDGGPSKEGTKAETWEQKQIDFGGIPETIRTLLGIMAGSSDIPVTRLLEEQQTGLSGSDAGSLRNYYDAVAANQKLNITPSIMPLDEMLIRSALGTRPPEIWYQWKPLYQMDEKTASEVDKTQAETAAIYAREGIVPIQALEKSVHNRMIETGRWPGLEAALDEIPEEERYSDPEGEADPALGETEPPVETQTTGDAAPRTLYVSRKVLNGQEIVNWAKSQGFATTLPAEDLHVTIVFSRTPVDWMKVGSAWESKLELPEGGPRLMEQFGEAKVLLFSSLELQWRHESAKHAGASWDHSEYQPHITISYGEGGMPEGIEPYQGKIVLGPEIFQEVKEDWAKNIKEE